MTNSLVLIENKKLRKLLVRAFFFNIPPAIHAGGTHYSRKILFRNV